MTTAELYDGHGALGTTDETTPSGGNWRPYEASTDDRNLRIARFGDECTGAGRSARLERDRGLERRTGAERLTARHAGQRGGRHAGRHPDRIQRRASAQRPRRSARARAGRLESVERELSPVPHAGAVGAALRAEQGLRRSRQRVAAIAGHRRRRRYTGPDDDRSHPPPRRRSNGPSRRRSASTTARARSCGSARRR